MWTKIFAFFKEGREGGKREKDRKKEGRKSKHLAVEMMAVPVRCSASSEEKDPDRL
jgi:hypothetical protein